MGTPNGPLQSTSTGLADAEVARLLSSVQFVGGNPVIDPTDLPAGTTLLSQGGLGERQPVLWAPFKAYGASQIGYESSSGESSLVLVSSWADEGTAASAPETTVLGEAPAGTDPPVTPPGTGEVRDVAVTQTVQQVSEVDASYSCELPSGSFGSVKIALVAGSVLAREPSGTSGSIEWRVDGRVFTEASSYSVNGNDGVVAISTDPAAMQLRVTRANGDRYVLDLVPVQNHPEVKVGVSCCRRRASSPTTWSMPRATC